MVVNLDSTAKFAGWEVHSFGLPANNRDFSAGNVLLNTAIRVDGKLILHDRLKIDSLQQGRVSGLRGYRVFGSFVVYSDRVNQAMLDSLKTVQAESGIAGVSRVESGLLIARYLGDSTEHGRAYFRRLWQLLRPPALGLSACAPRIWST